MTARPIDRRITPVRDDLAAAQLRNEIDAPRYAEAVPRRVAAGHAPLRQGPGSTEPLVSELLYGEAVDLYEEKEGWAWVQNRTDDYVGYVDASQLGAPGPEPTHWVSALRTYLYPEPSLKAAPSALVSLTSPVTVSAERNGYGDTGDGWVWLGHLTRQRQYETNITAIAASFLGTPYLWGGRTSIGLDCSAFIQIVYACCGIALPRDTDLQEHAMLEVENWSGDETDLVPGDLIYWKGHVALWLSRNRLIHANATHMAVTSGPLQETLEHIKQATGQSVSSVRRAVF
jgi:cell wall-associated NlpC family hydrolase